MPLLKLSRVANILQVQTQGQLEHETLKAYLTDGLTTNKLLTTVRESSVS
jgi:hypothetical protein